MPWVLELCLCPSRDRWAAGRWAPLGLLAAANAVCLGLLVAALSEPQWATLFTGTVRKWRGLSVQQGSSGTVCETNHTLLPIEVVQWGVSGDVLRCSKLRFDPNDPSGASDAASGCKSSSIDSFSVGFNVSEDDRTKQCMVEDLAGRDLTESREVAATMVGAAVACVVIGLVLTLLRGLVLQQRSRQLGCAFLGPKVSWLATFLAGVSQLTFCILAVVLFQSFLPPLLADHSSAVFSAWSLERAAHFVIGATAWSAVYAILLVIDGFALLSEDSEVRHGGYAAIKQPADANSLRNPSLRRGVNARGARHLGTDTGGGSLRDRFAAYPPGGEGDFEGYR